MKIVQEAVPTMTSGGIKETKGFNLKASREAFRILSSGMYSDPVLAIIRELSCNAWDSHVMAGTGDTPFDIELPTRFSPLFRIRDYGTGLSHEQVMSLYVTYFDSTKTEDNTQIGALGIGSKSPLGYTSSFSVVAYQDGEKRIYSVFIGDDDSENPGYPGIAFTGAVPTDEPNGIEISIPTQENDFRAWYEAAKSVYKWFPVKPNFVDTELEIEEVEIVRQIGKVCITEMNCYYYHSEWKVVQGNIAYPLDFDLIGDQYKGMYGRMKGHIVVNIGDVMMSPNRESLTYTKQTVTSIREALDEFERIFIQEMQKEVEAVTTYKAARKLYIDITESDYLKKSDKMVETIKNKMDELNAWMYDEPAPFGPVTKEEAANPVRRFLPKHFCPERSAGKYLYTDNAVARIIRLAAQQGTFKDSELVIKSVHKTGYSWDINRLSMNWTMREYHAWTEHNSFYVIYNDGNRSAKSAFHKWMKGNTSDIGDRTVVLYINKYDDKADVDSLISYLEEHVDDVESSAVSELDIADYNSVGKSGAASKTSKAAKVYITRSRGDLYAKWDKGCDLLPLIQDTATTYYWFTVKNTTPIDLDDDPKDFLMKTYRLVGMDRIWGVKEKDVAAVKKLSNWVHVNSCVKKLVKEQLTKERIEEHAVNRYLSKLGPWMRRIQKNKLLDTITHEAFKELMSYEYNELCWEERNKIVNLLSFAKQHKIKVEDNSTETIAKQVESIYNTCIGVKLIVNSVNYPDAREVEELIKLVNHFAEIGEGK